MRATHTTREALEKALAAVNKRYAGNIIFNRLDSASGTGTSFNFTLRCKDSKALGHRRGFPTFQGSGKAPGGTKRRRLPSACWHVHGYFFDALLAETPEAVIVTSGSLANPLPENKITIESGNWQDWDIGSQMNPYMMSEACDCE